MGKDKWGGRKTPLDIVKLSPDIPREARDWRNDEKIWGTCRQNHIITWADQSKWEDWAGENPTAQMLGIVAMVDSDGIGSTNLDTGFPDKYPYDVGVCGLTSINYHHGTAEFSLYIAPEHQGHGYGKAALIHLLDYGFYRLRLETIWGEAMQNNDAMKMFQNVGFTIMKDMCRSRYFKGGRRIGSFQLDITRNEFMTKWAKDLGYKGWV